MVVNAGKSCYNQRTMRRNSLTKAAGLLAVFGTLLPVGCAKSPSTSVGGVRTQMIVTLTVKGRIRPDYSYFVLFNVNNIQQNGQSGPIPVVAPPYGNGFAGGAFTHFVRYDQFQPGGTTGEGGYRLYAVIPGTTLRSFEDKGIPDNTVPVSGGSTLQFRLALSRLGTTSVPADQISSLEVNFVTTNRVPIDPNDTSGKLFDALGDSRQIGEINRFLTISNVTQARTYTNAQSVDPEPTGDVSDADLDITDYSIQIQN